MNDTNPKVVDVPKAFDALPQKGRLVECAGKITSDFDFNTHIQGLAAFRTVHILSYSEFNKPSGRLLIVDRTPGNERLLGQLQLPVLSPTRPFYFHPGGSQVIGDCLVLPAENGERQSFVLFMDISDPAHIHEVNPAVRLERRFNDAGFIGITNVTAGGKDFWVLAAYDNGATDTFTIVKERHFKTSGPADLFGTGCHFRWGGGVEILSATELALYCTSFRYDEGCNLNEFRAAPRAVRRRCAAGGRAADAQKRTRSPHGARPSTRRRGTKK